MNSEPKVHTENPDDNTDSAPFGQGSIPAIEGTASGRARHDFKKLTSYAFWGVIVTLACITIGMSVRANLLSHVDEPRLVSNSSGQPAVIEIREPVEVASTLLSQIFKLAPEASVNHTIPSIEPLLDAAYEPVFAAIPAYTDFHYSVLGEYSELSAAALGDASEHLEKILFAGFDRRVSKLNTQLDREFANAYKQFVTNRVENEINFTISDSALGPVTHAVMQDAIHRATISIPVSSVAAVAAMGGGLKILTKSMAAAIAKKIGIKAAAKIGGKGAAMVTGAGTGAALCSWSGPGAILCGAAGGIAMWFAADAIVVNIDEYFTRDEFEAEIHALVEADKSKRYEALQAALKMKAKAMVEAADTFTLQELNRK